jgi:hypothetical protein
MVADAMLAELKAYGKSLRPEQRVIYNRLLNIPLQHIGSITYASSVHAWAFLLLSILLEQEKKISTLEKKINSITAGSAFTHVSDGATSP